MKNRFIQITIFVLFFSVISKAQSSMYSEINIGLRNFEAVDQMPRFPGCEDIPTLFEKEQCSKHKLHQYIKNNLKYPKEIKENNNVKELIAMFIISKKGEVLNIKITKSDDIKYNNAAISVIESMNHMSEKWIPGIKDNKRVNIWYFMPLKFYPKS